MADPHKEVAKRLACAYVSYTAGHSGVDYLLKKTSDDDVGTFWIDLAEFIFYAMAHREQPDEQFKQMVSKYIQ